MHFLRNAILIMGFLCIPSLLLSMNKMRLVSKQALAKSYTLFNTTSKYKIFDEKKNCLVKNVRSSFEISGKRYVSNENNTKIVTMHFSDKEEYQFTLNERLRTIEKQRDELIDKIEGTTLLHLKLKKLSVEDLKKLDALETAFNSVIYKDCLDDTSGDLIVSDHAGRRLFLYFTSEGLVEWLDHQKELIDRQSVHVVEHKEEHKAKARLAFYALYTIGNSLLLGEWLYQSTRDFSFLP
jgi:hypothetical protein